MLDNTPVLEACTSLEPTLDVTVRLKVQHKEPKLSTSAAVKLQDSNGATGLSCSYKSNTKFVLSGHIC